MIRGDVMITGSNGQVGSALMEVLRKQVKVSGLTRDQLDLTNPDQIREIVRRVNPALIINTAAFTAVDRAEVDQDAAYQVNGIAPGIFGDEAARLNIPLIHFSTDYVFDGNKAHPYSESDATQPCNFYGKSKLAGEQAIVASGCMHLILRTSWVYGDGHNNFVRTMLRLGTERQSLRIVRDQIGAPTWSRELANAVSYLLKQMPDQHDSHDQASQWWANHSGIFHLTSGGETSWADFANRIFALRDISCTVEPILASEYPGSTVRPKNSRLDNRRFNETFGYRMADWDIALADFLKTG